MNFQAPSTLRACTGPPPPHSPPQESEIANSASLWPRLNAIRENPMMCNVVGVPTGIRRGFKTWYGQGRLKLPEENSSPYSAFPSSCNRLQREGRRPDPCVENRTGDG